MSPASPVAHASVFAERGYAAQDFRASRARVFRRRDAGETPAVCEHCATEVDVQPAAHDLRCPEFRSAA